MHTGTGSMVDSLAPGLEGVQAIPRNKQSTHTKLERALISQSRARLEGGKACVVGIRVILHAGETSR